LNNTNLKNGNLNTCGFINTRLKQGRPKKEENHITQQLAAKRIQCQDKTQDNPVQTQQLTGLFLLWSRKQLSQQQFISGLYYEKLCHQLKRSMGNLSGPVQSSLQRVHQTHLTDITNKIKQININESALSVLNQINQIIGYVHESAQDIVKKVLQEDCLESARTVKTLTYTQLSIFRRCLDIIGNYLKDNSIKVEEFYHIA